MAKARMDGLVEMVERVEGETRQRSGRPVAVAEPRGTMHVGRVFDASREARGFVPWFVPRFSITSCSPVDGAFYASKKSVRIELVERSRTALCLLVGT